MTAESNVLEVVANPKATRADVAREYALAIGDEDYVDWQRVNNVIIDHWSVSGLMWIKRRAWEQSA